MSSYTLVLNLGVEVKVAQTVKVDPADPIDGYIHVSQVWISWLIIFTLSSAACCCILTCFCLQVALGEAKKDKASEPVVLYLKVDGQKLVLGTLSRDDFPHLSLDIVLDKESELSHNSKTASVYFCGYKVIQYP